MWGSDGISVSGQRGNDLPTRIATSYVGLNMDSRALDYLCTMAKTTPSERIGHLVTR